jgi:hypothetical protein
MNRVNWMKVQRNTLRSLSATVFLLLSAGLGVPSSAQAASTVRELTVDPEVRYRSDWDIYYYCEDPDDCAAHYAAKITAEHHANGNDITVELINPQPDFSNTYQGLPFSVNFDTKITSIAPDGTVAVTVSPRSWWASIYGRCPLQSNGMAWSTRVVQYYPDYVGQCYLRIPQSDKATLSCGLGNPLYPESQLKIQVEHDYAGVDGLLQFERTYRSDIGRFSSWIDQQFIVSGSATGNRSCLPMRYMPPSLTGRCKKP